MTQAEVTANVFRIVRNFQEMPTKELFKKLKEDIPGMTETQLQIALAHLSTKG